MERSTRGPPLCAGFAHNGVEVPSAAGITFNPGDDVFTPMQQKVKGTLSRPPYGVWFRKGCYFFLPPFFEPLPFFAAMFLFSLSIFHGYAV